MINHYIQKAPWTSYSSGYGSGWHSSSGWDYGYGSTSSYGWAPVYDWAPAYGWDKHYEGELGHGTVTSYDSYGGTVYHGEPAYAKRTTIVPLCSSFFRVTSTATSAAPPMGTSFT